MEDSRQDASPQNGAAQTSEAKSNQASETLGSATYEIIRQRLSTQGQNLREQMTLLDEQRKTVFGSVDYRLLQADRIVTANNCIPQDMIPLGKGRFLFGFNVRFGMKRTIELGDVFAIFHRDDALGDWKEDSLKALESGSFIDDFKRLYNVYDKASFKKFSIINGKLYMLFSTGPGVNDIAVFKWDYNDGKLQYLDGRSETEFRKIGWPEPFPFTWKTPDRQSYRYGDFPHVSIEDKVFVECTGGDLTIKVEDNTSTGEGIYSESVEDRHQKVDDAEIAYTILENLILLKIRPYKEQKARFFIFNIKQQSVLRMDSVGESCALLPEDHGIIFPDGYYLASGEYKRFETKTQAMSIERVIHGIGGEDTLFVFYDRQQGEYALMPYRIIAQKVEERISCNGFCLFPDGHLLLIYAESEPQKHHMIQLRQTPLYAAGHEPSGKKDAFLYQVGNKPVVRCLAQCQEILTLVRRENPYAELYTDLVKLCGAQLDSFPWLSSLEGIALSESLHQLRDVADNAVGEFDKVRRLQREATQKFQEARKACEEQFQIIQRSAFRVLNDYVSHLTSLRKQRGELITLKDMRYADIAAIESLEARVIEQSTLLSRNCVKFLLEKESLEPYRKQAADFMASAEAATKATQCREIEKQVLTAGSELEMLIEIVNGLQIEDATESTRIIDGITSAYSVLNQVKAELKKRIQERSTTEGAAQFGAQLKLLNQSAASYLDLCDIPSKCESYLNRITVQLEELEGAFADFSEYTLILADRRSELYEAFEQRKTSLLEERNRKAQALLSAAERILKVVQNRLAGFQKLEDINAYMASDPMVAKVRESIAQLLKLEDSVKADDLQGRLKSLQQEAIRQLKDRQELFAGAGDVLSLGKHLFNINTQSLDLTVLQRGETQHLHLTSTQYFEPIEDESFNQTKELWDQHLVSENAQIYRSEFLAWKALNSLDDATRKKLLTQSDEALLGWIQSFMEGRYTEGYIKGVHDLDGTQLFKALLHTFEALGLARFAPSERACALAFWYRFCSEKDLWSARLQGFAERLKLFPLDAHQARYIAALQGMIRTFNEQTGLFDPELSTRAGEYLFQELTQSESRVVSQEADQLASAFRQHLISKGKEDSFDACRKALQNHPASEYEFIRDWVKGFLMERAGMGPFLDETANLIFCGSDFPRRVVTCQTRQVIGDMKGQHARIEGRNYAFDFLEFTRRLSAYEHHLLPKFEHYTTFKQQLLETARKRLRLDELKPKVLSSFVRNQLIDKVYLPLVGDNLAKQIGAAGDKKRTDLMGLLLLLSPPGYGKTTLLEYLANRLGLVFIKINGPALGHGVLSLDPQEAPNASAREEIHKLNLALEMGDNVMICVDDIQHCNPEFLQKFISLCDAQRKIEGVWQGKPRTYDLRGRKVVVVMAGNPYTESGQKFKIPDMLANRADTYNLGDIIGGNAEWFKASYIENAITSNSVLAPLANRNPKDIHAFIRMAELGSQNGESFEGSYSQQETEEILSILKKLLSIREIILKVNQEYIYSAGQADEFRTEPAFKLQGSYRNMNRLAEKVVPIMNEDEVRALVLDHYKNESQTLTTGAEANFLKFKSMIGALSPEESQRWEDIQKTFKRNQITRGADANDPAGRVVSQLSALQVGLEGIQDVIDKQAQKPVAALDLSPLAHSLDSLRSDLTQSLMQNLAKTPSLDPNLVKPVQVAELERLKTLMSVIEDMTTRQFEQLQGVRNLLHNRAKQGVVEVGLTQEMLEGQTAFLEQLRKIMAERSPS